MDYQHLAGAWEDEAIVDGPGGVARFKNAWNLDHHPNGDVLVTAYASYNEARVRVVTPAGVVSSWPPGDPTDWWWMSGIQGAVPDRGSDWIYLLDVGYGVHKVKLDGTVDPPDAASTGDVWFWDGSVNPEGLAWNPLTGSLWVETDDGIVEILSDATTGAAVTPTGWWARPRSRPPLFAFDSDGGLYHGNGDGDLLRWAPPYTGSPVTLVAGGAYEVVSASPAQSRVFVVMEGSSDERIGWIPRSGGPVSWVTDPSNYSAGPTPGDPGVPGWPQTVLAVSDTLVYVREGYSAIYTLTEAPVSGGWRVGRIGFSPP